MKKRTIKITATPNNDGEIFNMKAEGPRHELIRDLTEAIFAILDDTSLTLDEKLRWHEIVKNDLDDKATAAHDMESE